MSLTVRKVLVRAVAPIVIVAALAAMAGTVLAQAQPEGQAAASAPAAAGGEANLVVPDLGTVQFHGWNGNRLLMSGLVVCALGLMFSLVIFTQLKNLPVHASMREVSELIYETC